MEGHDRTRRTHDIEYVKRFLGHKSAKKTEIYFNIDQTLFESTGDEFMVKVTEKPEDVKGLLEAGFEWVGQKDSLILLKNGNSHVTLFKSSEYLRSV